MNLLEKIIFVADYIEPNRCKAPNLSELRRLAFEDLTQCVCRILEDTLNYLEQDDRELDEMTRTAYEYYSGLAKEKKREGKENG